MNRKLVLRAFKQVALVPLLALIVLWVFMASTNPDTVHPALLTVPFILLAIAIATFTGGLFKAWGRHPRPYTLGLIIALCPTILLLLRSIGQLTGRDALFMGLFGLGIFLYARKLLQRK